MRHLEYPVWRRILGSVLVVAAGAQHGRPQIDVVCLGSHDAGVRDEGAAEISAFDPASRRLFVVNGAVQGLDVLDLEDPAAPRKITTVSLKSRGHPHSVAVRGGLVAVTAGNPVLTDPGTLLLLDVDGTVLRELAVGPVPDMVVFSPDGRRILVACEGEAEGEVDPPGSVAILDLSGGVDSLTLRTADFSALDPAELDASVRVREGGFPADLEPEYIAVAPDSRTAWVTLQENNAVAVLDLEAGRFLRVFGLGLKDHSTPGAGLDPSDRDGGAHVRPWPVHGFFQPDGIAAFAAAGATWWITANEGEMRDGEGMRVAELTLDPAAFPEAGALQREDALGRLYVDAARGDTDGDGDVDRLLAFGARSFSIWSDAGERVFDSGDWMEQSLAAGLPGAFNSDGPGTDTADRRSDRRGPEPEGVAIGTVGSRVLAFVGVERGGGFFVADVTDPRQPVLLCHVPPHSRMVPSGKELVEVFDRAPEGLLFVAAEDSPGTDPLLVVTSEDSGTTTVYAVRPGPER